jgi:hypothetical protein
MFKAIGRLFQVGEGKRKVKSTMIGFFPILGSVVWLGTNGTPPALTGETLVSALWIPAAVLMTGLGTMAGENLSTAIKRKNGNPG